MSQLLLFLPPFTLGYPRFSFLISEQEVAINENLNQESSIHSREMEQREWCGITVFQYRLFLKTDFVYCIGASICNRDIYTKISLHIVRFNSIELTAHKEVPRDTHLTAFLLYARINTQVRFVKCYVLICLHCLYNSYLYKGFLANVDRIVACQSNSDDKCVDSTAQV